MGKLNEDFAKAFLCKIDPIATEILNLKLRLFLSSLHILPQMERCKRAIKVVIEFSICAEPCAKYYREFKMDHSGRLKTSRWLDQ